MFEFEKVCERYEDMIFDERKAELESLSAIIVPELMKIPNGLDAFKVLIKASCAADGELQGAEFTLVSSAVDIDFGSFEEFEKSIKEEKDTLIKLADITVDQFGELSEGIKNAMVSFCLCIVSADRRVSMKEKKFIKKLINI